MDSVTEIPAAVSDFAEGVGGDAGAELDTPAETLLSTGAAIAAGALTRRTLSTLWRHWRGAEPPDDPTDADVTWTDALLWAAAVGAAVGVARVVSGRGLGVAASRLVAKHK